MPQPPRSKVPPNTEKAGWCKVKTIPPHALVYKRCPLTPPLLTIPKAQWTQHCLWVQVKAPPPPKTLCPHHVPIKRVTFQYQQPLMDILVKPPPPPPPTPKPPPPKPPPLGYVPPKHPPPQPKPPPPSIESLFSTVSNLHSQPAMPPPPPPLPTIPSPSALQPHPSNPAVCQKRQHYRRSPSEYDHSNPSSPYFGHWWLSPRLLHQAFPCPMPSLLLPRLQ